MCNDRPSFRVELRISRSAELTRSRVFAPELTIDVLSMAFVPGEFVSGVAGVEVRAVSGRRATCVGVAVTGASVGVEAIGVAMGVSIGVATVSVGIGAIEVVSEPGLAARVSVRVSVGIEVMGVAMGVATVGAVPEPVSIVLVASVEMEVDCEFVASEFTGVVAFPESEMLGVALSRLSALSTAMSAFAIDGGGATGGGTISGSVTVMSGGAIVPVVSAMSGGAIVPVVPAMSGGAIVPVVPVMSGGAIVPAVPAMLGASMVPVVSAMLGASMVPAVPAMLGASMVPVVSAMLGALRVPALPAILGAVSATT